MNTILNLIFSNPNIYYTVNVNNLTKNSVKNSIQSYNKQGCLTELDDKWTLFVISRKMTALCCKITRPLIHY